MIIPAHFEDLHTHHVGTETNRCYFIPASTIMCDLVGHREHSDRFQLLNGNWKFKYCESIYEFEDLFYEQGYDASDWDTIPVPSAWQNHGYDKHQYTNIFYPFPADPPYVPYENPCGAYLTDFVYRQDTDAPKALLNFEGVDSCFYVWLNGRYLGYSEVSHSTSEFDISQIVKEGRNTLAVLVLKWCDGSYLEDQDKFRHSGIFRDVYILKRPENCVRDYFTTMQLTDDTAEIRIRFVYRGNAVDTDLKVLNAEQEVVATGSAQVFEGDATYTHQAVFAIKNPILWNPEQPYLYTVIIETPNEVITDRMGIREIHIENNKVYLNGNPIIFHGVNRHDSNPVTGPVISVAQMIQDLRMIKEFNFNAIRTSHYPNAPVFYQLCDQYGFMVVDEADHESHGAAIQAYRLENDNWVNHTEYWNEPFADNPDYMEHTMDRVQRCVQRDKNRPSVICWSMGNESAYGCCFEAALAWTKSFDPDRLTHYEGAQYHGQKRKYDFSNLDLYSDMYSSMERLQKYVGSNPDKPFILCEYAHAMGNGPGDMEDYWQFIHENEVMCGGFVWEWCDHAVYAGDAENGKAKYLYGGDHNEYPHDGNFCIDGLVYPDRTPHTGLFECKNVNRPVRVQSFDQETGTVTLHNYMDFVSTDDYLTMHYELTCDGDVICSAEVDNVPSIRPHAESRLQLRNLEIPAEGRCYLKLSYFLKEATEILPAGFPLGFDEIKLSNQDGRNQKVLQLWDAKVSTENSICITEDDRYLKLTARDFDYTYDKFKGMFSKMNYLGKEILDRPMDMNIWRAPTDNDRYLKQHWFTARYDKAITRAYHTVCEYEDGELKIRANASISAVSMQKFVDVEMAWTVSGNGALTVEMQAKRNTKFPELPRFGLRMFLPNELEKVTYFGLGPAENYSDKRNAVWHGLFADTVTGMHEDYIRPQENGSHCDCDYVTLESDDMRITAIAPECMSFSVSHFTQEELTEKGHNFELEECGSTVLCLDYKQNGIGSNSCGPALINKYRFLDETFNFSVRIVPEVR